MHHRQTVILMLAVFGLTHQVHAQVVPQYTIADSIRVARVEGYRYVIDAQTRRLYGAGRYIVNVDTKAVVDSFADTASAGGFAIASSLGRGLTRTGVIFDSRTSRTLGRIAILGEAGSVEYDPVSRRGFLFGIDSITVVDLQRRAVVSRFSVPEARAAAVADGNGRIYVAMEDSAKVAVLDARAMHLITKYSVAPGLRPMGLAIDTTHRRLFVSCAALLVVLDLEKGRVVATVPMTGNSDQNAFDPKNQLIFMSNGRGKGLTIVHEDSPDRFAIVQNIPDPRLTGLRVFLDSKTHNVYVSHLFPDSTLGFEVLHPSLSTTGIGRQ